MVSTLHQTKATADMEVVLFMLQLGICIHRHIPHMHIRKHGDLQTVKKREARLCCILLNNKKLRVKTVRNLNISIKPRTRNNQLNVETMNLPLNKNG